MTSTAESLDELIETARLAAAAAAGVHERQASRGGARWTERKTTSSDFVSDVDVAAQKGALKVIRSRHPTHRIMAEEEDDALEGSGGASFLWTVDPLDGTTNYLHGHPFYASSVAVWDETGPVAGVVHASVLGHVWSAARGRGAWEDGRRIRVSQTADMGRYLIGTGFPFKHLHVLEPYLQQLGRVLTRTAGVRRAGAAAIDLAYVANGTLDAFWELRLEPWDFGAGILLITEAGGVVERLEGGPVGATSGTVLAANTPGALRALRGIALGDTPQLD